MIDVIFDKSQLARAAQFTERNRQALLSAVRSESYRLNLAIQAYAKSQGQGSWNPYSPITKVTRKGFRAGLFSSGGSSGYAFWVAKFTRYFVDAENLTAYAGFMGKGSTGTKESSVTPGRQVLRFGSISNQFVEAAKRHATGYNAYVGPKTQRWMAKRVLNPNAQHFKRLKSVKGAQRKWNALAAAIPKTGWHRVKARPFAGPVLQAERERSIRNIRALYTLKFNQLRYDRDWAQQWGNK